MPQRLKRHNDLTLVPPPAPRKRLELVAGTAHHPSPDLTLARPPRLYALAWFDFACFLVLLSLLGLTIVL